MMIITKTSNDILENMVKIRKNLGKRNFAIDVVIIESEDLINPVIRRIMEKIKILYDGLGVFFENQNNNVW